MDGTAAGRGWVCVVRTLLTDRPLVPRHTQNPKQFVESGCDNCRQFEDQEEAAEFTSPHFTGYVRPAVNECRVRGWWLTHSHPR